MPGAYMVQEGKADYLSGWSYLKEGDSMPHCETDCETDIDSEGSYNATPGSLH
jgi:hypothetical protein